MEKLKNFLEKQENYIDYPFGIDDYDEVIKLLDVDELIIQEIIDRIKFQDIISVYKTSKENLFFIRMEQYGYADEDAVIYRICFTKDIEKTIEECKEYMKKHDFIKMMKNT